MRAPPALLGLSCALTLGCNGDDTPPRFFDSGSDAADATADGPDASDAGGGDAKIIVVNASADLGAIRLCVAIGLQNDGSDATIVPITPLPSAAIGPGVGSMLPDLGDLSHKAVTPYAVLVSSIGTSTQTCDSLVNVLASNKDYFVLPTVKNGTFAAGTTELVAITGCVRSALDSNADTITCGASYNATVGNLLASAFQLDKVIANSQRFGAQIVHASSSFGTQGITALLRPFDGGADEIIASNVAYQTLAPKFAASLAMPTVDQTSLVVSADNADGGTTSIPLPLVYEATTGQATGENAYFVVGSNYTFVLVGDPRAPTTLDGGVFNGFSLHALAYPNGP